MPEGRFAWFGGGFVVDSGMEAGVPRRVARRGMRMSHNLTVAVASVAVRKRWGREAERKVRDVMEGLERVLGEELGVVDLIFRLISWAGCRSLDGLSSVVLEGVGLARARVSQMPIVPSREQVARIELEPGWKATCFTL